MKEIGNNYLEEAIKGKKINLRKRDKKVKQKKENISPISNR